MVKLSHENYYTKINTALSNSKVGDYLKSPSYFFRRHILHNLKFEKTASVKVGQVVDAILSKGEIPFQVKVRKMDNATLFEAQKDMDEDNLCTEDQMQEGIERAQAVQKEPIYKEYSRDTTFQKILQTTYTTKTNKKIDICGMIDALTVKKSKGKVEVFIDDFKSVSEMKVRSPEAWMWNCVKMGYHRQMAAYGFMLLKMNPRWKNKEVVIHYRHIVVTKHADSLYKVYCFKLGPNMIQAGLNEFCETIEQITEDTTFKDPPVTWETAKEIDLSETYDSHDEEEYTTIDETE